MGNVRYKFRAWHKDAKEMFHSSPARIFAWKDEENQPMEIMQYTGLKDKNGKEIYEGDILKGYGKEITRYVVAFTNGSFDLYHNFGRWGLLHRMYELDMRDMPPEIIGNIHENPDLLAIPG
jgi:uncharacterized phage protein (TIGR01671 family)